jgi:hypothetical protein
MKDKRPKLEDTLEARRKKKKNKITRTFLGSVTFIF